VSTHIGRNDPCPCGSGRKYKQCCLVATEAASLRRHQLREAEGRLMPELFRVALDAWGKDGFLEAQRRFYAGHDLPEDPVDDPEFESLFITWFGLQFTPAGRRRKGLPSAAAQLLETARDLSEIERRFLAEVAGRPVSFHHITAVDPGHSIDLADLLTGETCRVLERTASQTVRRGGVIFARTLTLDGTSIMIGSGTTLLPPDHRPNFYALRDRLAAGAGVLTTLQVLALDDVLRRAYLDMADQIKHPPMPRLQNTDGDALTPTTLHFTLQCTPDEAFEALRSLHATDPDAEAAIEDPERDAQGRLVSFGLDWTKAGNRLHQSWDNTILGRIDVEGQALTAAANSKPRATRLRKQIEKRLAGRVLLLRTVTESVDAMLAQAQSHPTAVDALGEDLSEVAASFTAQHWEDWLDMRVPALGHLTPREAAETPAGREQLSALLDHFEWQAEDGQPIPVERLRKTLGL
jgi:hypothetical protein